ncbi:UNVERIFIED_CONTAM: hypothetical protein PYX00_002997 [Menopon gallinae]|uniref:Receptor-binding cancer antigen expressed on SiSo cells n=1 Tax=Menopon gallinae TaxID=328185 RepID=A0AAW2HZ54_9NEOP
MMVKVVLKIFLSIFHFFIRTFKRALCCLKRRRRPSCEPLPLTNIGIVQNSDKGELQAWGNWEDVPTIITDHTSKPIDPIQQKIEQYREQMKAPPVEAGDPEDNIDFFQDMTPTIVKQKKLLLQQKETDNYLMKSNLSLAPDPTFHSSELGVWDDSQTWEDQTEQDWDANEVLREKKRMERERRLADHQRKKHEVRGGRSIMATKIS